MEYDVTEKVPHPVHTRFELAIGRMIEAWLAAGRIAVSASDVKLAREFLEQTGSKVEEAADGLRVISGGRVQEFSREAAVMAALRRLALRR